jgi:hypothetical protein
MSSSLEPFAGAPPGQGGPSRREARSVPASVAAAVAQGKGKRTAAAFLKYRNVAGNEAVISAFRQELDDLQKRAAERENLFRKRALEYFLRSWAQYCDIVRELPSDLHWRCDTVVKHSAAFFLIRVRTLARLHSSPARSRRPPVSRSRRLPASWARG